MPICFLQRLVYILNLQNVYAICLKNVYTEMYYRHSIQNYSYL